MHTFYEFFAGGGMARAGLGPKWQCLFANDFSVKKADAYARNWGMDHFAIGDIFNLVSSDLPGHADLAWGSFPCQDLSLAGTGAGLEGRRSGAFWGFWNLVRSLSRERRKPRMIMLENVYGALTSHGGKDFDAIASALYEEDYLFGAMLIDAVHFVPQSRPRLFILAVDGRLLIPEHTHTWTAMPSWHPDAVIRAHNRMPCEIQTNWRWWNLPSPEGVPSSLEELIDIEPKGVNWHSESETSKLIASMSEVNRRKVMEVQASGEMRVGTVYRRTRSGVVRAEVRFDGISGCLRTPTGGSSRQTIIVVQGERIRSRLLSPREAARLMGLPDEYQLPERYNDAYHLAGDGVVIPVVRHISRNLLEPILDLKQEDKEGRLAA